MNLPEIGSIPACAGEPIPRHHRQPMNAVYPRVCGGTQVRLFNRESETGLSPRVRGNQPTFGEHLENLGSIPACAGEPVCLVCDATRTRVYPRVCGGTNETSRMERHVMGLSPRVRGNRRFRVSSGSLDGSIPACAGEPLPRPRRCAWAGVYPRVCGGTTLEVAPTHSNTGLSPRVRGNQGEDVALD